MKKTLTFILALCLCVGLCACGGNSEPSSEPTNEHEEATTPTEPEVVIPEVQMIINDSSEDTTNALRIFPVNRSYDQWTAYAHYFVKSEKDTETIRIKLEEQWGRNEKTEGDFEVESDNIIEVETNKWLTFPFSISASNLYFYRLTIYYGEQENVLATRTIYTPYKKAFYDESSFNDSAPKFHPINGLLDDEQTFVDSCQYAVVDYAKTNHYTSVNSITGWQAETKLYLHVEYKGAGGYETIWFAIRNDNPESYVAHFNSDGIIPDNEGTAEQNVLNDYYYVEKALTEAIAK